jgi:hypothetical protein
MATRPFSVVFDSIDPDALGRFWATALGWGLVHEDRVAVVELDGAPGWGEGGPPALVFVPSGEPKRTKNRVHVDLPSSSLGDQRDTVGRLLDLGATERDVGQRDAVWVVLADPEGNEFCVLHPSKHYRRTVGLAAVLIDCADPAALRPYWEAATGWPVVVDERDYVAFQHPGGTATRLELLTVPEAKQGKNRLHVDLAPLPGDDLGTEVARLERAGATRTDIGQGDASWVVLADPEGNEHCVLTPR